MSCLSCWSTWSPDRLPAPFNPTLPLRCLRPLNGFDAAQVWHIVAPKAVKIETVGKVSTARKLGVAARVASQQAQRNRLVRAAGSAVATTGRAFGRVLHQLWLEVAGLIFLVMASSGGIASVKEYTKYEAGRAGLGRVVVAICFTVTFTWFGVSSFWRVRKKGSRAR
ncbi:MAG: hypothetical protein WAM78_16775 [Candidatus Sulfotelmatobacter sp.]